jgi:hypothetical protein
MITVESVMETTAALIRDLDRAAVRLVDDSPPEGLPPDGPAAERYAEAMDNLVGAVDEARQAVIILDACVRWPFPVR